MFYIYGCIYQFFKMLRILNFVIYTKTFLHLESLNIFFIFLWYFYEFIFYTIFAQSKIYFCAKCKKGIQFFFQITNQYHLLYNLSFPHDIKCQNYPILNSCMYLSLFLSFFALFYRAVYFFMKCNIFKKLFYLYISNILYCIILCLI